MANKNPKTENLQPGKYKLSRDEAKKGGIKSGEVRRQNKTFKEIINKFLDGKLEQEELKQQMLSFGFADEEISNKSAVVFSLWKEAIKGNTKATEILRDTIGEKPVEKQEIKGEINNPFAGLSTDELRKILNE
ncbi:MAG: hypothetical protein IJ690_07675 [Clostridia bacterium]|nr:hypothetical protein [Clostridia bacterium]MBR1654785.1 hypothetical protein [Clostridia bacterium]